MNLKPEELVKVLLYCGNGGDCDSCCHPCHGEHGEFEWRCLGPLLLRAATQIEHDQKEIEALREENERLTLPPPSPGTECYNLLCPYRHNSTQSAYSCAMVRLCAARKLERSRTHEDEP